MFLLTRDGFLNHCPVKPLVICQPLIKFDMCSILFVSVNGGIRGLDFLQDRTISVACTAKDSLFQI